MKKLITALILTTALAGCIRSKQQKAEALVKKYLDSSLNDPHSYESVKFGKLDTFNTRLQDNYNYKITIKLIAQIQDEFDEWKLKNPDFDGISDLGDSRAKYLIKMNDFYSNQSIAEMKVRDSISMAFKPSFGGWAIDHTYRAKNGFGALGLQTDTFVLDSGLTKVLNLK